MKKNISIRDYKNALDHCEKQNFQRRSEETSKVENLNRKKL
jgi:hypothetical protein